MKKVAIHTLGCKVNAYESEAMEELLLSNGFTIVPFSKEADIYIVNTCTVTNMADRKSRQMLSKARKLNPEAIIVAAGCYVQTEGEEAKSAREVNPSIDIILGNNMKQNLIEVLARFEAEKAENIDTEGIAWLDINQTNEYETLKITKAREHTRAIVKVQDGCNQFCSYCMIPYVRGRARSRSLQDVLEEVKSLAKNGTKEVVLTGIHLSSYGIDFREGEKQDLASLVQAVASLDGLVRVRLGSLEPRIITEEFLKKMASLEKLCWHFHLSLQSGCDETLKRMNRKYNTSQYEEAVQRIRSYNESAAITTDIIVGFPRESIEEFEKTKAFVEKIGFFETHIFKYSKRKGTKASIMEGQILEEVKTHRSKELLALNERQKKAYEATFTGKEVEILLEEKQEIEGKMFWSGHTKEYLKFLVADRGYKVNDLVTIVATK